MLTLLCAVAVGTLFAIFGTQNTEGISLNFGQYTLNNVPTYLAVLTPLVLGLLIAYFIYLARHLSESLTINEQKDKIKKLTEELAETTKTAHKLQLENIKLKKDFGQPSDSNSI
jgi:uncharacterized integral membrane protein